MKIKTKTILILFSLLVIFVSGCLEEKQIISIDKPGNISSYEFEVSPDEWSNGVLANTTTYHIMENKTQVQAVHFVINTSKIEIIPTEDLGGNSEKTPLKDLVLLVSPANETKLNQETLMELSNRTEVSNINYTLYQKVSSGVKIITLEFEEPVTGFIAYTFEVTGNQNFVFVKPDSEFIKVILPKGYSTGNRFFGIPSPTPANITFDGEGKQTLLWNSSEMGNREKTIQVKFYPENAPIYFFAAIVALLAGSVLVLIHYSRSKKELEIEREILELEKRYEKKKQK